MKTFTEYHKMMLASIDNQTPEDVSETLLDCVLGITVAAGKAAHLLRRFSRHKKPLDRERLVIELGDVLWYLSRGAHAVGLSLEDVATTNAKKIHDRGNRHG